MQQYGDLAMADKISAKQSSSNATTTPGLSKAKTQKEPTVVSIKTPKQHSTKNLPEFQFENKTQDELIIQGQEDLAAEDSIELVYQVKENLVGEESAD